MNIYSIERYGATFKIEVGHDDHAVKTYEAGLLSEHHMLDWIEKNVPHDGCWIDAGANIGNHTLAFALWADRVIAIEPVRENFVRLERNIHRNPQGPMVVAVRLGIGNRQELMGAVKGGTGQDSQYLLDGPGSIPVVALDSLIPHDMPVRLLKMDVEGMEVDALEGAMYILQKWHPEVFVEIWEAEALERITAYLAAMGYKLIERFGAAPTYHFSASGRYPVTYRKPAQ
jgi:FkbM family methyltransferase